MPKLLVSVLGKDLLWGETDFCAPGEEIGRRIRKCASFTGSCKGDSQQSHFYGASVSREVSFEGGGF